MQRPVMNPTFLDERSNGPPPRRLYRRLLDVLWRSIKCVFRVLRYDPLSRRGRLRIEDGSPTQRMMRAIAYRVAFVPVLLAGITCLIVYTATHPGRTTAEKYPSSLEIYYEPVTFVSSDAVALEGWLFPALEAKQVIADKDKALRRRYPAVVLVHDFGATRGQMLPLVRPLHDAGFVVLAMNTRGNGASGAVGQTYGLREALDVKAAVEMLRRRSFVNGRRIAIVAAGTGATATIIAAKQDATICALVLTDPVTGGAESILDGRLGPPQDYLSWLRPLCKWTFELAYQVDADEMEWSGFKDLLEKRPVLVIGEDGRQTHLQWERHVSVIRQFLSDQVADKGDAVVRTEK